MGRDVGDIAPLTMHAPSGATVTVTVTAPDNTTAGPFPAPEVGSSGEYPYGLLGTMPGVYTAKFTAIGVGSNLPAVETYYERFTDGPVPLATIGDYITLTGQQLTPEGQARVTAILRSVSEAVRAYVGRDVAPAPEWLVEAIVQLVRQRYDRDPSIRSTTRSSGDNSVGEVYTVPVSGWQPALPGSLTEHLDLVYGGPAVFSVIPGYGC